MVVPAVARAGRWGRTSRRSTRTPEKRTPRRPGTTGHSFSALLGLLARSGSGPECSEAGRSGAGSLLKGSDLLPDLFLSAPSLRLPFRLNCFVLCLRSGPELRSRVVENPARSLDGRLAPDGYALPISRSRAKRSRVSEIHFESAAYGQFEAFSSRWQGALDWCSSRQSGRSESADGSVSSWIQNGTFES